MPPKAVLTRQPIGFDLDQVTATGNRASSSQAFEVHLDIFAGPFDLLLSLIARHKLDVTEVALASVTDEFIAYIRSRDDWDLSLASDFLVVAATLLDLKAARLLPTEAVEDPENLALLEARDLLFARLLQYRAFKEVAAEFAACLDQQASYHPRAVSLEPQFAALLPDLVWQIGPARLATIAQSIFDRPTTPPTVDLEHLHDSPVSVSQQANILTTRLRSLGSATFRDLVADIGAQVPMIVARFLALLELYRVGAVAFEQVISLGEMTIRWMGLDRTIEVSDEYDRSANHD